MCSRTVRPTVIFLLSLGCGEDLRKPVGTETDQAEPGIEPPELPAGDEESGLDTSDEDKASSTPAVCGDGRIEADERCDDGGTAGGDGCSARCTREDLHFTLLRARYRPAATYRNRSVGWDDAVNDVASDTAPDPYCVGTVTAAQAPVFHTTTQVDTPYPSWLEAFDLRVPEGASITISCREVDVPDPAQFQDADTSDTAGPAADPEDPLLYYDLAGEIVLSHDDLNAAIGLGPIRWTNPAPFDATHAAGEGNGLHYVKWSVE